MIKQSKSKPQVTRGLLRQLATQLRKQGYGNSSSVDGQVVEVVALGE